MLKVFYVFAALALLSLAISAGGKWFGRSIAMAGHTDDRSLQRNRHRQQCDFCARQRDPLRARRAATVLPPGSTSICAGRTFDGYSEAARDDFNHAKGARNIIFLSFEERMMSRDMSGRFAPIYASMIVRPGVPGPAGTLLYGFTEQSGYLNEVLAVGERARQGAFVARCLVGRARQNRWRPASATSISATI